jgi:SPW repeat
MKRWQDWVNAVLGVALIASPWILGFAQARGVAAWDAWILGGLIVIVALASQLIPAAWGEGFHASLWYLLDRLALGAGL